MAKKVKLTRPELKRYRDALGRFERYLPMLKLKQQQLQMAIRDSIKKRREAARAAQEARERVEPYQQVLADLAGVDITAMAKPNHVQVGTINVAGVNLPTFESCSFPKPSYSLFATPAWVDRTLLDLREISRRNIEATIIERQYTRLQQELTKISQRVNLFDKVKIPEAKEAIRVIQIKLGDEMTAGVGRAKIAKSKISQTSNEEEFDLN